MLEAQAAHLDSALAAGGAPDDSSAPPVVGLDLRSPWEWSGRSNNKGSLHKRWTNCVHRKANLQLSMNTMQGSVVQKFGGHILIRSGFRSLLDSGHFFGFSTLLRLPDFFGLF